MSSVPAPLGGTLQTATIRGDTPHWSPYPGLRPFQPDDSEYFFGRDAQVDDVVARLRDKRFVAVIGGSGSGKSSLVLAGAIPRLRTYAIKDAGDFWVPVIATPGTNHVEGDSPLRRLAQKFCSELVASPDASARLEACVALLRRQDGLGELVERFGGQIKGAGSVDLNLVQVNFLFLVDQFEELFHPSNERSLIAADCQHLVDRIVEQFKKQHPQVCVALTMRSEHLNDCPRYDELPDAINAASYLVKRLNREQLRHAIEQPVLRYHDKYLSEQRSARRQARREGQAQAASAPISTPIVIEEKLIVRLLDDSKAVLAEQGHADQLPLLQHLLFWIWYEANLRCKDQPLIDALTLVDLWKAVGQSPGNQTRPPDSSINTLEDCLQNRCEAIFTDHVIQQKAWQEVFRSLAFKEPNTGTYTQQRASMTELRQRLGIVTGDNVELAAHLQLWMKPHGYLHWDLDSGTVKVTHETLIRRWKRFRDWIDEEDRQFRVYLRLLDDSELWKTTWAARDGGLSGGATLRRYEDEQLPIILKDPVRVARINRLLGMDRDRRRQTNNTDDAIDFLDLSIKNRGDREQERNNAENLKRLDAEKLAQVQRDREIEVAKNEANEQRFATQLERAEKLRLEIELDAKQMSLQMAEAQALASEALAEKSRAQAEASQAQALEAQARSATSAALLLTARAQMEAVKGQAQNTYEREKRKREQKIKWAVSLLSFVVLVWLAIELPVRMRVDKFFAVERSIGSVNSGLQGSSFSSAHDQLKRGLAVIDDLGYGLSGYKSGLKLNRPVGFEFFGSVWPVSGRRKFFDDVSNLVEPRVNGTLRQLMTGYPWPVVGNAGTNWLSATVKRVEDCEVASSAIGAPDAPGGSSARTKNVKGTVYVANSSVPFAGTPRALIVTDPVAGDLSWDIRPVTLQRETDGRSSQCTAGPSIWRSPPEESSPAVAFDATLQYLLQLTFNPRAPPPQAGAISVTELSWLPGPSGSDWVVGSQPPAVLQDAAAVNALDSVLVGKPGERRRKSVPLVTTVSTAGVMIKVREDQQWRFVATEPSSIPSNVFTEFAQPLTPEAPISACNELKGPVAKEHKARHSGLTDVTMHPHGGYCFAVIRGTPAQGYSPSGYESVRVSVYPTPLTAADDLQPIASMSFGFQPKAADRWLVAEGGSYTGWIALDVSKDKNGTVLVGAPWSTTAVMNLGKELLSSAPTIADAHANTKSGVKK